MCSYENEFIKFDTIKLRTKIDYIKKRDVKFTDVPDRNGNIKSSNYNSKYDETVPFNLYININYKKQSLTIEFSSKILLNDYPQLITINTFKKCLDNLNDMKICELDSDAIMQDSYFTKLHITKDITFDLTHEAPSVLNSCTGDYRRYKPKYYEKSGITFNKNVIHAANSESLTIYNKEKEIELSKNKRFLNYISNPQSIKDSFKGKIRIEMILFDMKQIRNFFNISSSHIENVFRSNINPILIQFNKIFTEENLLDNSIINDYETLTMNLLLEKYDFDLRLINQFLKDNKIYKRDGLSKRMKKLETLHSKIKNKGSSTNPVLNELREKLQNKC